MLVEFLIEKSADKQSYIEEFNFINDEFLKFKDDLERKPDLNDEINFLMHLKSDTYEKAYDLMQEKKNEEAIKYLTVSNIIHSMFFNPDFYA